MVRFARQALQYSRFLLASCLFGIGVVVLAFLVILVVLIDWVSPE